MDVTREQELQARICVLESSLKAMVDHCLKTTEIGNSLQISCRLCFREVLVAGEEELGRGPRIVSELANHMPDCPCADAPSETIVEMIQRSEIARLQKELALSLRESARLEQELRSQTKAINQGLVPAARRPKR